MRIDNLRFHPVRLQALRMAPGTWKIKRTYDDKYLGTVRHVPQPQGPWSSLRVDQGNWYDSVQHRSFKTACLRLARMNVRLHSEGVQDYGECRMLRVGTGWGSWYTVIFHKHGPYIYDDHTIQFSGGGPREILSEHKQAELRAVLQAVQKFQREKL